MSVISFTVGDVVDYLDPDSQQWIRTQITEVCGDSVEVACKPGPLVFAPSNIRPTYRPGSQVEYYSESHQMWVATCVTVVHSDGSMEVACKPGARLNPCAFHAGSPLLRTPSAQAGPARLIGGAPARPPGGHPTSAKGIQLGSNVEYYSQSHQMWVATSVTVVHSDGSMEVACKPGARLMPGARHLRLPSSQAATAGHIAGAPAGTPGPCAVPPWKVLASLHERAMTYAPPREEQKVTRADAEAADILEKGGVRLVSALWLIQEIGKQGESFRIKRHQELPSEAFIPCALAAHYMRFGLKKCWVPLILALSYRWMTKTHPDPNGFQVGLCKEFLEDMLAGVYSVSKKVLDIGVFWDFMSLPQIPRTEKEEESFMFGLQAINKIYASKQRTLTLQLRAESDGVNQVVYAESGWCRFEAACSSLQKDEPLLVAISSQGGYEEIHHELSENACKQWLTVSMAMPPTRDSEHCPELALLTSLAGLGKESRFRKLTYFPHLTGARDARDFNAAMWKRLCCGLSSERNPPLHPDDMQKLLEGQTEEVIRFTNGADTEKVVRKYRDLFEMLTLDLRAFYLPIRVSGARYVAGGAVGSSDARVQENFATFSWTPKQWDLFTTAIQGFQKVETISMEGLEINEAEAEGLVAPLTAMPSLTTVILPDSKGVQTLKAVLEAKGKTVIELSYDLNG